MDDLLEHSPAGGAQYLPQIIPILLQFAQHKVRVHICFPLVLQLFHSCFTCSAAFLHACGHQALSALPVSVSTSISQQT